MNNIVSNCPLCEEKSLHVIEEGGIGTQQCINCGYASTSNFIGTKEDNEAFKTLSEEMKVWAKEANDRIWIPSMMTEMVDIPEEEQKNYPREDGNGFHTKKYDTDNQKIYDIFLDAMVEMNQTAKALNMSDRPTITSDNG